ncbi:hypothetical protein BDP27DRAFT_1368805 [Rhodocollybia butyracea]|uniref:Uncharacterized protein n=1 Tax=Rhodocollybia butyracea TaxID=206335 RepID=A0A9P5PI33_9AGAR|nr:hypothetical protein BDP27DRAFT_1368805 [Rhodocollybia butyracea]
MEGGDPEKFKLERMMFVGRSGHKAGEGPGKQPDGTGYPDAYLETENQQDISEGRLGCRSGTRSRLQVQMTARSLVVADMIEITPVKNTLSIKKKKMPQREDGSKRTLHQSPCSRVPCLTSISLNSGYSELPRIVGWDGKTIQKIGPELSSSIMKVLASTDTGGKFELN